MSHFDNLVTTIANAFLNPFTDTDATEFPVVDVTDPTHATLEGTFDLTTLARIIITAGWVHVDELDRLRALDGAVEAIRRTSGAVEIAGVRIEPCDEYGATDTTRDLDRLRASLEQVWELVEWSDPARLGGVPCVRGTRVPVDQVVNLMADVSPEDVPRFYPTVEPWQAAILRILGAP